MVIFMTSHMVVGTSLDFLQFSSMSKCAKESFATSASAKQKPVHSSRLIAWKMFDKSADMDCHSVPPPAYRAGGDSVKTYVSKILKELPCRRQERRAPDNWILQEHQALDDRLRQKTFQVLMEKITSRSSTIPQRISSRKARKSTNCSIKYWTIYVQHVSKILPLHEISRSTLRSGANLRATAGLHFGLQGITTKTAKGLRWTEDFQAHKIWCSLCNYKWKYWSIAKTHTICKSCRTGAHFDGQESRCQQIQQQTRSGWKFACSEIPHCVLESRIQIRPLIGRRSCKMCGTNMNLSKIWILQVEKCKSFGTYYQVLLPLTSRSISGITWMGKIQSISMKGTYSCPYSKTF